MITIIGMLMALLLPAVNAARESGRRAVCLNNENQVGKALLLYDNSHRQLPGYVNKLATSRKASWAIMAFQFMERKDVYSKWADSTIADADVPKVFMDILICPSDPPETQTGNPLSYVVNCGKWDASDTHATPTQQAKQRAANGMFTDAFTDKNNPTSIEGVVDGTTYTLMVSENIQAFNWSVTTVAEGEKFTGFLWFVPAGGPPAAPKQEQRINGRKNESTQASNEDYARPSSNHPGGVNVTFADGHTTFLREDVDYKTYIQLMTPNSVQSTAPADVKSYTLNDSDYR